MVNENLRNKIDLNKVTREAAALYAIQAKQLSLAIIKCLANVDEDHRIFIMSALTETAHSYIDPTIKQSMLDLTKQIEEL